VLHDETWYQDLDGGWCARCAASRWWRSNGVATGCWPRWPGLS
jgi:hypothetical protein